MNCSFQICVILRGIHILSVEPMKITADIIWNMAFKPSIERIIIGGYILRLLSKITLASSRLLTCAIVMWTKFAEFDLCFSKSLAQFGKQLDKKMRYLVPVTN